MPTYTSLSGNVTVLLLDGGLRGETGPTGYESDATIDTKGVVQLAGDLSGVGSTAASPKLRNVARVFNVREYGALGDGINDDTASIQAAINASSTAGGGTVYVPEGIYMIKAHVPGSPDLFLRDAGGVALLDNTTLVMDERAILRAIPNNDTKYVVLRCFNKQNVTVIGGQVEGERTYHSGVTGEWGYGIAISAGSNITIRDTIVRDCWGDGINIQQLGGTPTAIVSTNVLLSGVTSDNNRRQGLSIEGVIGLLVEKCTFSNTNGTAPKCGVDIEPYNSITPVENITFRDCIFRDNESAGLLALTVGLRNLTVDQCLFIDNLDNEAQLKTLTSSVVTNIKIMNSKFSSASNVGGSILIQGGTNIKLLRNELDDSIIVKSGLSSSSSQGVILDGNTFTPSLTAAEQFIWLQVLSALDVTICNNIFDSSLVAGTVATAVSISTASVRVAITRNTFLNIPRAISVGGSSKDITVNLNDVDNAAISALNLGLVDGVSVSDNTFAGVCHQSSSSGMVFINTGGSGYRFTRNTFYQAPRITTTAGLGTTRALLAIQRAVGAANDVLTSRNRAIKDPSAASFTFVDTATTALTTGYIGESNSGIMTGPTAFKPSAPIKGSVFYDTTLNRLETYNGTVWVISSDPGYTTENITNKSTSTSLGTSNTLYPSQNAVKTYVDTVSVAKVGTSDIEITDTTKGLILKSPDGVRWRVTIDNSGALVRTVV